MRFVAVLTLLLACAGCQFDPHAHLYTTERPLPANVAGTYRLARQTITPDGLAAFAAKPCVIVLRSDGTFEASRIPPASLDGTTPRFASRLVDARGTWRIDDIGAVSDGIGPLRTHWGIRFEAEDTSLLPAGLTGKRPPYGLIFTLGDPDSGHALLLEK